MHFGARGSQLDHWVDRPDVEALQGVELTGTNKPMTCHIIPMDWFDEIVVVASTIWFPRGDQI